MTFRHKLLFFMSYSSFSFPVKNTATVLFFMSYSSFSFPVKNTATVPGPVWEPITVPMS